MMIYRYLSEQFALHALQTGEMKVGRLLELNDPADCQPVLRGAPPQATPEDKVIFAQKYFRDLYQDIGVVCYSSVISDPVLWSHYADCHRGIALGFDFEPSGDHVYPVHYQDNRPEIDYQTAELLRPNGAATPEFMAKVIQHGFTHKAKSWSYESEHRRFVWLGRCKMRGLHYFEDIGIAPDRIVLGVRCRLAVSDVLRSARMRGGAAPYDPSHIVQARMDPNKYTLEV